MRAFTGSLLVAILSVWTASTAWAAEGGCCAPPAPCARQVVAAAPQGDPCCATCPRWHLRFGAWVYGVDGTLASGGRELTVETDWTETLDSFDKLGFAFLARVRLDLHRWRFAVGVDGANVGDAFEFTQGNTTVVTEMDLWNVYATAGYVFAGGRTGCSACAGTWCLDAYLGARWWSVGFDMEGTGGVFPAVSGTETWVDPIVGLHLDAVWPKWIVELQADVGGFGAGSDFSWMAMGGVGYRFTCRFSVMVGYRFVDVDREDGDFRFDVTQSGPFITLDFNF